MKKPLNDTPVKGKHEKGKVKGDGGEHLSKRLCHPFTALKRAKQAPPELHRNVVGAIAARA